MCLCVIIALLPVKYLLMCCSCHFAIGQVCVVVVLFCYWLNMCCFCVVGQVCYVITMLKISTLKTSSSFLIVPPLTHI
jgi:hypothetical protein